MEKRKTREQSGHQGKDENKEFKNAQIVNVALKVALICRVTNPLTEHVNKCLECVQKGNAKYLNFTGLDWCNICNACGIASVAFS